MSDVDGSGAVRVAILNDYQLVVAGVAGILQPFADRVVVVELDSRTRVRSRVDVVLYDTFAQTQGGAIANVESMTEHPGARLLVYTWNVAGSVAQETRRTGASGMIAKGASAEELVEAIERVHRGERVFSDNQGTTAAGGDGVEVEVHQGRWPGDEHGVSARESEVLALICQGLSNAEIAGRMYVSVNTIKTYIRAAYRKIDVTTRPQAVLWAVTHGFMPDRQRHTLTDRGTS